MCILKLTRRRLPTKVLEAFSFLKGQLMEFYRQCVLQSGTTQTVGWIEERGARVGLHVTLEDYPGQLWKVMEVNGRLAKDFVFERERDYLNQRKTSDVKSGSRERF